VSESVRKGEYRPAAAMQLIRLSIPAIMSLPCLIRLIIGISRIYARAYSQLPLPRVVSLNYITYTDLSAIASDTV
jgi:hypothetical protein